MGEPLQGLIHVRLQTQGSRKLEPWAQISERLRRNSERLRRNGQDSTAAVQTWLNDCHECQYALSFWAFINPGERFWIT